MRRDTRGDAGCPQILYFEGLLRYVETSRNGDMAEGMGRDTTLRKAQDFCGFSILAVPLSVSRSVCPKQPLLGSSKCCHLASSGTGSRRVPRGSSNSYRQSNSKRRVRGKAGGWLPRTNPPSIGIIVPLHNRLGRSQETPPPCSLDRSLRRRATDSARHDCSGGCWK